MTVLASRGYCENQMNVRFLSKHREHSESASCHQCVLTWNSAHGAVMCTRNTVEYDLTYRK